MTREHHSGSAHSQGDSNQHETNQHETMDSPTDRSETQSALVDSTVDWMPLSWCNLSRNPFGELTREERAELAVVDTSEISQHVQGDHTAVQMIGQCGRGKTTRMLALMKSLPEASYVYLPEDQPCPSIAAGCPLLIDEAQRLPRRIRKSIFATGLPLVLATHRDLTRSLQRAGYRVHTIRIGQMNNAKLVCELLNRRIAACQLDRARPIPTLSLKDAEELVARFGSDIRGMESYLYDVVQSQASTPGKTNHGEMRFSDRTG